MISSEKPQHINVSGSGAEKGSFFPSEEAKRLLLARLLNQIKEDPEHSTREDELQSLFEPKERNIHYLYEPDTRAVQKIVCSFPLKARLAGYTSNVEVSVFRGDEKRVLIFRDSDNTQSAILKPNTSYTVVARQCSEGALPLVEVSFKAYFPCATVAEVLPEETIISESNGVDQGVTEVRTPPAKHWLENVTFNGTSITFHREAEPADYIVVVKEPNQGFSPQLFGEDAITLLGDPTRFLIGKKKLTSTNEAEVIEWLLLMDQDEAALKPERVLQDRIKSSKNIRKLTIGNNSISFAHTQLAKKEIEVASWELEAVSLQSELERRRLERFDQEVERLRLAEALKELFVAEQLAEPTLDGSARYSFSLRSPLEGYKQKPTIQVMEFGDGDNDRQIWSSTDLLILSSETRPLPRPLILNTRKKYTVLLTQQEEGDLPTITTELRFPSFEEENVEMLAAHEVESNGPVDLPEGDNTPLLKAFGFTSLGYIFDAKYPYLIFNKYKGVAGYSKPTKVEVYVEGRLVVPQISEELVTYELSSNEMYKVILSQEQENSLPPLRAEVLMSAPFTLDDVIDQITDQESDQTEKVREFETLEELLQASVVKDESGLRITINKNAKLAGYAHLVRFEVRGSRDLTKADSKHRIENGLFFRAHDVFSVVAIQEEETAELIRERAVLHIQERPTIFTPIISVLNKGLDNLEKWGW